MTQHADHMACRRNCWLMALVVGIIVALLLRFVGEFGWGSSLFLGIIGFIVAGFLLIRLLCSGYSAAPATSASTADAGVRDAAADARAARAAEEARAEAEARAAEAKAAEAQAAADAEEAERARAEAAARDAEEARAAAAREAAAAEAKASADAKAAAEAQAAEEARAAAEAQAAADAGAAEEAAAATTANVAAPATSDDDSDGDGVAEVQPITLDGPRGGAADDLKRIKGVGPGLEKTLNELGIYHFDQIAAWGAAHVEWVDARLKFKGRITRDEWIDQAKTLASGQDTAFSKRVDDGNVY